MSEALVKQLKKFKLYLQSQEKSKNTMDKYLRDVGNFFIFVGDAPLEKPIVLFYKEHLVEKYAPASVNSMLAAVNSFLTWIEHPEWKVKPLKIQRDLFSKPEGELTQKEYDRLVRAAQKGRNPAHALLLQTICATGIRVSELQYITYSALCSGRTTVACKGKRRTIFIPKDLCKLLKRHCAQNGIKKGPVFITKNGKSLDRSNIWKMLKSLCKEAKVAANKVFPHNLRHLFARTYYKLEKDLGRLADILGHTSINTTRIYTMETGKTHARQIDRMKLVVSLN